MDKFAVPAVIAGALIGAALDGLAGYMGYHGNSLLSAFIRGALYGGVLGWLIWLIWLVISRWEESLAIRRRMAAVLAGALVWAAISYIGDDGNGDYDPLVVAVAMALFGGVLGWIAIRQWEKNNFATWIVTALAGALIGALLLGWLGQGHISVMAGAWFGALIGGGLVRRFGRDND